MPIHEIGSWLLENRAFTSQLDLLTAAAVADDLGPAFERQADIVTFKPDWRYLLLCASFLAASQGRGCQATALRIAQSCLAASGPSPERKDAAGLLLDTLANHPALELAETRGLIQPILRERLPLPARVEWTRRSIQDSISNGDRILRVNRFQKLFWNTVLRYDCFSVSAPTSAGKSFIVAEWVASALRRLPLGIVAYLVPTRALISQVERDMRAVLSRELVGSWDVISTPVRSYMRQDARSVLVFTQERLQILLRADPNLKIDILVIDEAHKIGDRNRGVLLQQVIEDVTSSNADVKIVFVSPATSNPETLIADLQDGRNATALLSDDITVNQNLIWVTQLPRNPRLWKVQLCLSDSLMDLGTFVLPATPIPSSKRLPFVGVALGNQSPGNVIYVNGAADAEKAATQIYDLCEDITSVPELDNLIALSTDIVHPQFLLSKVLRRGIAFHYGNLPLLLRKKLRGSFHSESFAILFALQRSWKV